MRRWLYLIAFASIAARATAQNGDEPRAVVRAAARAVEQDGSAALAAGRRSREAAPANDRAAQLRLATLARLTYDYPAAERAYRSIIAGGRDRYAVYAQVGLAEGLDERGFGRDADLAYDQALRAARDAGDRAAEADVLLRLATLRGRVRGLRVGEALLDSAARLIPPDALDLRARLVGRRAINLNLNGHAAEASRTADSAVVLARRAHSRLLEADAYRWIGQILQYRGQLDSALVALRRAETLYVRAHARGPLASLLIWQAQVLGGQGRFGEMRSAARRALAEGAATHNGSAVGSAYRALGVLSQMLGDWSAATANFRRSYANSAAAGDSSGMILDGGFLARASLAAGDVAGAHRLVTAHLAYARDADDFRKLYADYRFLANVAAREGDTAAVTRALDSARAQLPRLPGADFRQWLLHDEARHALARGDLTAAERSLVEYLAIAEGHRCIVCRFETRVRLADVHARRGDVARAERELVEATDEIDQWRAQLGDAELRTLAFQSAITVDAAASERGATAARAARVLSALAADGRAGVAFALAERWRARELGDQLVRSAALRRALPGPVSAGAIAASARSASDVVAALPDARVALLEYVAADSGPVTLFVVQRGGVRARVLDAGGTLAADVVRFGSLLESGADAARLGRALGAALVDPALPLLDPSVTRLVVVPDGPLHRLPFDALRMADGRYVLERFAVSVVPSASVLTALWARGTAPAAASPLRLLALGDPDLPPSARLAVRDVAVRDGATDVTAADSAAPDSTTEALRLAADEGDPLAALAATAGFPRLTGAAREARLVARYAPAADVRLGAQASAAFLKHTDLRRYGVLHVASHAIIDERSATGSAIVLAPGGGESGFVGAGDLAALRLAADLVVLSQCRSAGGALVTGEGVQGLTSPLLQAGARAVVATAWRIGDQATVPFVDAFYAALARGMPLTDALRDAKLRAVRRGDLPRTWGAFLAIGDPLVVVPLRPAPPQR